MFGARIQRQARRIAESIVRPLAAIGVTPNVATLLGLLLSVVTAGVLMTGHLRAGGALALLAGIFDMFDGALARVQNRKTTFGAFFDSTLDRYAEGLVLLGVLLYALGQPATPVRTWVIVLTYVAGLSSLMVSYAKARAEGLGLECKVGLMARPERVLLLAIGLMVGGAWLLPWTMGLLALTSTFTAVQRIVHVWLVLERPAPRAAHDEHPARMGRMADVAAHGERD
jgi:CDP-diacylglycerol---glycerol-3-phosphate 3-phosphatidyltransferase